MVFDLNLIVLLFVVNKTSRKVSRSSSTLISSLEDNTGGWMKNKNVRFICNNSQQHSRNAFAWICFAIRSISLNLIKDESFNPKISNLNVKFNILMAKSILVNTTFMDLGDMTLLCVTFWTLCRKSTTSGARKPKVSKANSIKTCWLSEQIYHNWPICLTQILGQPVLR